MVLVCTSGTKRRTALGAGKTLAWLEWLAPEDENSSNAAAAAADDYGSTHAPDRQAGATTVTRGHSEFNNEDR